MNVAQSSSLLARAIDRSDAAAVVSLLLHNRSLSRWVYPLLAAKEPLSLNGQIIPLVSNLYRALARVDLTATTLKVASLLLSLEIQCQKKIGEVSDVLVYAGFDPCSIATDMFQTCSPLEWAYRLGNVRLLHLITTLYQKSFPNNVHLWQGALRLPRIVYYSPTQDRILPLSPTFYQRVLLILHKLTPLDQKDFGGRAGLSHFLSSEHFFHIWYWPSIEAILQLGARFDVEERGGFSSAHYNVADRIIDLAKYCDLGVGNCSTYFLCLQEWQESKQRNSWNWEREGMPTKAFSIFLERLAVLNFLSQGDFQQALEKSDYSHPFKEQVIKYLKSPPVMKVYQRFCKERRFYTDEQAQTAFVFSLQQAYKRLARTSESPPPPCSPRSASTWPIAPRQIRSRA